MKSRFLIFTLFLAVICIGNASNAMAQSVTGTGVFLFRTRERSSHHHRLGQQAGLGVSCASVTGNIKLSPTR